MKWIWYRFVDGTKNFVDLEGIPTDVVKVLEKWENKENWQDISDAMFHNDDGYCEGDTEVLVRNIHLTDAPADAAEYHAFAGEVIVALKSLPYTQQKRMLLHWVFDLNHTEIARLEGVSAQAVWHSIKKARKKLKFFRKRG